MEVKCRAPCRVSRAQQVHQAQRMAARLAVKGVCRSNGLAAIRFVFSFSWAPPLYLHLHLLLLLLHLHLHLHRLHRLHHLEIEAGN